MKVSIDEVSAGPALDNAAALALGWKRMLAPSDFGEGVVECWFDGESRVESFKPSTDANDALILAGVACKLVRSFDSQWSVVIHGGRGRKVTGKTLPLAITRAFLKAKGVTELEVDGESN